MMLNDDKYEENEWEDTEIGDKLMNTYIEIHDENNHKTKYYNNVKIKL